MKFWRTDNPDIFFMEADPVQFWANGIVEFKIDRRNDKFLLTPVMRDHSEGPVADCTNMFKRYLKEREQRR